MTNRQGASSMCSMETLEEFTVTEAGMRAVLETVVNQNHAITELSHTVEMLTEQAAITELRLQTVEAALAQRTLVC
jgi:hypothetical protein